MFGGNNVRDEFGLATMFPEHGSGASYAAASKLLDAVACLKGNVGQQSDAPAAYTQSDVYEQDIEGHEIQTFVGIPEWQWNDHMKQAYAQTGKRPVCKLLKSLYGHPSAGLFWERKYKQVLRSAGFREMIGWECLFFHEQFKVILSVYVDDFKMAARDLVWPKPGKPFDGKVSLSWTNPLSSALTLDANKRWAKSPEQKPQSV